MPRVRLDATGTTDRTVVVTSSLTENEHIDGVTVVVKDGSTTSGETHVKVQVYAGSPIAENVVQTLVEDYVDNLHDAWWTGNYLVEANEGIMLSIRDSNAVTVRMTASVQKAI